MVDSILGISGVVYPYRAIPPIHERNALREVLPQRVGKFLYQTSIALYFHTFFTSTCYNVWQTMQTPCLLSAAMLNCLVCIICLSYPGFHVTPIVHRLAVPEPLLFKQIPAIHRVLRTKGDSLTALQRISLMWRIKLGILELCHESCNSYHVEFNCYILELLGTDCLHGGTISQP